MDTCDKWYLPYRDMLATGCEDKNVRVFYTATNSENPLKVFSGKFVNDNTYM